MKLSSGVFLLVDRSCILLAAGLLVVLSDVMEVVGDDLCFLALNFACSFDHNHKYGESSGNDEICNRLGSKATLANS